MTDSSQETILIIGGGLAGLTAAYRLHQAGLPFHLLEARERLGGRIFSAGEDGASSDDGFDLGPSWFWPDMHPDVARLAHDLGLSFFPQYSNGAMVFQRSADAGPEHYNTFQQEPPSMRLAGGSSAIVSALASGLPQDRIHLGKMVTRIEWAETNLRVHVSAARNSNETTEAAHVILALPPRLLAETVEFDPPCGASSLKLWRDTPTWMAPHAKFFALYERPFWRAKGLSGAAQSMVGPLVEIHDATTASGKAAIFGFVGVPAQSRARLADEVIIKASVAQLGQLFGPEALKPTATLYKDWASDPLTATVLDQAASGHPMGGRRMWEDHDWQGRITLAGSETAARDPGYLAGAVEAGERAARSLIDNEALHSGERS